jgi:hypothetical protein
MLYQVHLTRVGFDLTMLVVIGSECIGGCKSNYHTITSRRPSNFTHSVFQHILCCVFVLFIFVLPVSLDCPFLIAPLVFSNVYLMRFI